MDVMRQSDKTCIFFFCRTHHQTALMPIASSVTHRNYIFIDYIIYMETTFINGKENGCTDKRCFMVLKKLRTISTKI